MMSPEKLEKFWRDKGQQDEQLKALVKDYDRLRARLHKLEDRIVAHLQHGIDNALNGKHC